MAEAVFSASRFRCPGPDKANGIVMETKITTSDFKELYGKEKLRNDKLAEELEVKVKQLTESSEKLDHALTGIKLAYIETIHRFAAMAESKDEHTGAHIKRLGLYSRELAQEIGMEEEFLHGIYYAAPMHDIGKMGIPDAVLCKQGPLTPQEFDIMKTHTTIGAEILKNSTSSFLIMAEEIALSHHERWDGLGYPQGLKESAIPIAARIVNLADQYDALTSRRPYKNAMNHPKVFKILTAGDGRSQPSHFDPQVLEGFKRMHKRFEEIYESYADYGDAKAIDF